MGKILLGLCLITTLTGCVQGKYTRTALDGTTEEIKFISIFKRADDITVIRDKFALKVGRTENTTTLSEVLTLMEKFRP